MEKIILLIFFTSSYSVFGDSSYYSSFFGKSLSPDEVAQYTANGTLANCTILVEACDETEGRRIDGTCNNLKHPSYGGTRTPYKRLLEASYHMKSKSEFEPRRSVSGDELALPRKVRTTIWAEGRVDDEVLSSLINHLAVFFATDITNTRDTTNYVTWRPYCCKEAGRKDYACTPNKVPKTDYVHRFSGIRCLNMTRPLTFQTSGCLPDTTTPLRIVDATPIVDLSPVYGNKLEPARRTNSGGKLVTVTTKTGVSFPDTSSLNLLLGINFVGIILFWNNHNFIATKLAEVNPCWSDQQLFEQAREINIAYGVQLFYYELMATLMGKDKLIGDKILSSDSGFRDMYDESVLPQISLEYPLVLRWMHSLQDGDLRMYDKDGTHKSTFPIVDLTSNTDFLKVDDTMESVTQGFFRQPAGNSDDYTADPDIVERGLGGLQRSNDIMTNDLAKNRYFGFQSYVSYREYCFGTRITSFDDLLGIIDVERISQLKELYLFVEDIDLLSGIWVEKKVNSHVPPTFYCIVAEQLKTSLVSDRHWYERADRPNAFSLAQLQEIRKATAARLLCDIGAGVTEVQPRAFEIPAPGNEVVSCDNIPAIDYSQWKDSTCTA